MLHDSEDSPLDGFDGKKRQRTDLSLVHISAGSDLADDTNEHSITCLYLISVATKE